jgi:ubiquinone/menaquinone biosynthesis C-methylase UbiE
MPVLTHSVGGLALRQDDGFWADGEDRCREILHLCNDDVAQLRGAVSAWVDFSMEYLTRQSVFVETGRYASTSFDHVRSELYDNPDRMRGFYLIALMFSFVFSANYVGYYQFFRAQMLPRIRRARRLSDIGCGHGVYLCQMLLASQALGIGLDISATSLDTTGTLLDYYGLPTDRYRLALADLRGILPVDGESQDGATCFEVLEHLEDPGHALEEIHRVLRPGAPLCVSAAVRMESVDHLFVFEHPRQVTTLLTETGFDVLCDDVFPLTSAGNGVRGRKALADDPRVALGYIALGTARPRNDLDPRV